MICCLGSRLPLVGDQMHAPDGVLKNQNLLQKQPEARFGSMEPVATLIRKPKTRLETRRASRWSALNDSKNTRKETLLSPTSQPVFRLILR